MTEAASAPRVNKLAKKTQKRQSCSQFRVQISSKKRLILMI